MCTSKIILLLAGSPRNVLSLFGLSSCLLFNLLFLALDNLPASADADQAPVPGLAGSVIAPQLVPEGAEIAVVPLLESGRLCSISVLDREGHPVKNAAVYLEGELLAADSKGVFSFLVPERESFEIALAGEGKRKVSRRKFTRKPSGRFFAESDKLAEISSSLLATFMDDKPEPVRILYAPSVLTPGSPFMIIGRNFSDKIEDNSVDIDGLNAPVLSASPGVLLSVAPARMAIGPQKELFISVAGIASNLVEVDIAGVSVSFQAESEAAEGESSILKGKVGLNGSSLPALIKVSNLEPETASLWSPKQEPMGKNNILLSPGGERNYFELALRLLSKSAAPKIEAENLPLLSELSLQKVPQALFFAELKAEILRLARRKIEVETRLDKLSSGAKSAQDSEKEILETKALSLRLSRLSRMLAARHAIFTASGGLEDDYRKALDEAASGALTAINLKVPPITIVSDGTVCGASVEEKPVPRPRKGRLLRMLEPPIKLLPPMSESELAIMKAKLESEASLTPPEVGRETAKPSGASSGDLELRPGLPEEEPQVSASDRAPAPVKKDVSAASTPNKSSAANVTGKVGAASKNGKAKPAFSKALEGSKKGRNGRPSVSSASRAKTKSGKQKASAASSSKRRRRR